MKAMIFWIPIAPDRSVALSTPLDWPTRRDIQRIREWLNYVEAGIPPEPTR